LTDIQVEEFRESVSIVPKTGIGYRNAYNCYGCWSTQTEELSMKEFSPQNGLGTLVTHFSEGDNPENAHIMPLYQTSTFRFPDVATAAAIYSGELPGNTYSRTTNPNPDHFARKLALLEAIDLWRSQPGAQPDEIVAGKAFASDMAAISSAVLARVRAGETVIVQESLYSNAFNFFHHVAPRLGIRVVWVNDYSADGWSAAFKAHPETRLVYVETPANPTMLIINLEMVAGICHPYGCWMMVDNTFATPYCQRPLSFGADIVVHSTTKYLSGHGLILGGVVISPHLDYIHNDLKLILKTLGGAPSPFDSWLANLGLKTLELRMQRHCENAMAVARYLLSHPQVDRVHYPGLESDPGHLIARKQMTSFGGMLSFELKGGLEAGERLMNCVQLATLAASLGNVDSLIQHPASMTHAVCHQSNGWRWASAMGW
jgi:methionine-gamma-lyase